MNELERGATKAPHLPRVKGLVNVLRTHSIYWLCAL